LAEITLVPRLQGHSIGTTRNHEVQEGVCVSWAQGREVCLSYYDHLRSMLVTSPLSLLLTRIKGYYQSTTYPHLPPTSHSLPLSDKVMSADFGAVCLLDPSVEVTAALRWSLLSAPIEQLSVLQCPRTAGFVCIPQ
jgi:hypothetical protein